MPSTLRPPRLRLPEPVAAEIIAAATGAAPLEACGLLVGSAGAGGAEVTRQTPARNVHSSPGDRFLVAPEDYLAGDREARAEGFEVIGFWHSHPATSAVPSTVDRDEAWRDVSYLIVSLAGDEPVLRSWRFLADRAVEEELTVAGDLSTRGGG